MDFEKICMMFSMEEPFYGMILSSMERVKVDDSSGITTFAVARSGNVFKLYYNPKFADKLNVDTILQILKHEVLHIAFNHFTIWDYETFDPKEQDRRNIAEDLEINCYLDRSKIQKEAGGCFVEDLGFDRYLGTREYYKLLAQKEREEQEQKAQAQQPVKPCNDGQNGDSAQEQTQGQQKPQPSSGQFSSGQGTPQSTKSDNDNGGFLDKMTRFDDHSKWPDADSDATKNELQEAIDSMIAFAAEETEKRCGTIPGEMVGRIEKIRKKPKPVADWKRYFRRYIGNEFSELIKKSKKRESRRFPDAAGNRHQRKSNILVAIDTSGSVSMPEYREFFGQLLTLREKATFRVVECDATIQYEYEVKNKPNETLHGGGGTSFQPPIDLYLANRKKYDALVYFTDGYAPIPDNTPKDTLWVISSQGDQSSRKRYKVNGASVVFIPQHN